MAFRRVHIDLKMMQEQCAWLMLGEEEGSEGGRTGVLEQQKEVHSQGGQSVGSVVENEVSFHLFNVTSP